MIEWNDGLSIGIDVLDNDHKKLLLIINKLSSCLDKDTTQSEVNNIIIDLEKYGMQHFQREEFFMKEHNYDGFDEHVVKHKSFVIKIAEFKEKLLLNHDNATIHEVSTFLTEWLMNHIIHEDMLLVAPYENAKYTENKKNKQTFFISVIQKITDNISLTKRIFLSMIIPLTMMAILGFLILMQNYNAYSEMKKTTNLTNIIYDVNTLIHEIQIQRGLSSGHISTKDDKYKASLQKQYIIVHSKVKELLAKVKTIPSEKLLNIQSNIDIFKQDIHSLKILQKDVLTKEINLAIAIGKYTKIIQNILDITLHISFSNNNIEISKYISALSAISHFKESLGQERAIGTMILERKHASTKDYTTFMGLVGSQKIYMHMFEQFSVKNCKNVYRKLLNSTNAKEIYFYESHIAKQNFDTLDSHKWFVLSTNYINDIKTLEDKLLNKTNTLIEKSMDKYFYTLVVWFILITFILIVTLVMAYTFDYSSKKELCRFVNAMKHLSEGKRDMKLRHTTLKDVMSRMYTAYEIMRQKLLEADIYMALFNKQKILELENQKNQNAVLEKLASIDPLTSCVNRRQFEKLSNTELQRATRFNNPLSFLMLDIDHFKLVNDTYGHAAGDEVLKHFSAICLKQARDIDVVARIGGEEFVVMLPNTNADGAYIFAERFREKIYNSNLQINEQNIKYTVSIGIAILDTDTEINTILERADKALYEAKDTGRNKSVLL